MSTSASILSPAESVISLLTASTKSALTTGNVTLNVASFVLPSFSTTQLYSPDRVSFLNS